MNDIEGLVREAITTKVKNDASAIHTDAWDAAFPSATGLKSGVLRLFQDSEVNNLKCHYMSIFNDREMVGKANIYETSMDFTSMDSSMPPPIKTLIKEWHPGFLDLSMVECGLFAMNGDGLVCDDKYLAEGIAQVSRKMEEIAKQNGQDLIVFRDVPFEKFAAFERVLKPLDYYPCAGFTNAVIDIEWSSIDEYLGSLNSKTRHKLKSALKIEEKYGIRVEISTDFATLSCRMAELWSNVSAASDDYSRENLTEEFFKLSSQYDDVNSEAILFFKDEKLLAFMWNLVGENDYHMADWGVDYQYEHYKEANFYRAASVISLERAITLGKQRMQLGMTNYVPKKLLGAKMQPLTYFIKHIKKPDLSSCICRLITDAIEQPERLDYYTSGPFGCDEVSSSEYKSGFDKLARSPVPDALSHITEDYQFDTLELGEVSPYYPDASGSSHHDNNSRNALTIAPPFNRLPIFSSTPAGVDRLENTIAKLFRKEAALSANDNISLLSALSQCIFSQAEAVYLNEGSSPLVFTTISQQVKHVKTYANIESLAELLATSEAPSRAIVYAESIHYCTGETVNLTSITDLKQQFGFTLCLDETEALGYVGEKRLGLCIAQSQTENVDILYCRLYESLNINVSLLATSRALVKFLKLNSVYLSHGVPLDDDLCDQLISKLINTSSLDGICENLIAAEASFAAVLDKQKVPYLSSENSKFYITIGDASLSIFALKELQKRGVFAQLLTPPSVQNHQSGICISLAKHHSDEQAIEAAETVSSVMHRIYRAFEALS